MLMAENAKFYRLFLGVVLSLVGFNVAASNAYIEAFSTAGPMEENPEITCQSRDAVTTLAGVHLCMGQDANGESVLLLGLGDGDRERRFRIASALEFSGSEEASCEAPADGPPVYSLALSIEHPMGLGHPSVTVTHLVTWTYDESGRLVAPPTGTMMGAGEMNTSIRPEVRLCSTSPDL